MTHFVDLTTLDVDRCIVQYLHLKHFEAYGLANKLYPKYVIADNKRSKIENEFDIIESDVHFMTSQIHLFEIEPLECMINAAADTKTCLKLSAFDYFKTKDSDLLNEKYKFHFKHEYELKIDDDHFYGITQEPIINNEKRLSHDMVQQHHYSEPILDRELTDLCLVDIQLDKEIAERMLRYVYKNDYKNLRKIEVINGGETVVYEKKGAGKAQAKDAVSKQKKQKKRETNRKPLNDLWANLKF